MLARKKWHDAKTHAKIRGIEFHFTFEEWVSWWTKQLGPDWLKLRGKKPDQFVMARIADVGPYCVANVECITFKQNGIDQAKNGKSHFKKGTLTGHNRPNGNGIKITPEIAITIYKACGTQRALAKKYNVSERLVRLIKGKKVWRWVLADL